MASKRLAALTPAANTVTELVTSDVTAIASVVVTNTSTTPAEVSVYVKPVEDLGNADAYVYLAANLSVTAGQTFETFRFPITVGDVITVSSTTAAVNFSVNAVYDAQGGQSVIYSATEPLYPSVGDIWVSSNSQQVSLWTGSSWNAIAINAPAGPAGPEGPQGPQGLQGEPALVLNIVGTVADVASLPQFGDAIDDAYYVEAEGVYYIWKDFGWAAAGPLRGPTGPAGVDFTVGGVVATASELPADISGLPELDPDVTYAFYVQDEGVLYAWVALISQWRNIGPLLGPTGPQGLTGATGPQGETGVAFTFQGAVTILERLDDIVAPSVNDAYYVSGIPAEGTAEEESPNVGISGTYIYDGTQWIEVPIVGVVGPTGPLGPTGPYGLNAYELAVLNGFEGDEAAWLQTLQGDASAYSPSASTDWDVVPSLISEALDELAERVRILETP